MPDPSLVRFRRAVESACASLESRRQEVNDLNVFPVADGDTGDNMAMTLRAVLTELDRMGEQAREMADRVVAFRVRADEWYAEAKLSQDKPADERARILGGLEGSGPYANAPLAAAMRRDAG